jgi:hypothetical protein
MADPISRPSLAFRILPLLLLAVVLTLFFAPALFGGQVYFFRDLCLEIVPKRQFWADFHGFVLWNPYIFTGEPYAANPQASAFYPPSLLFLLGPAEVLLGPYFLFHFLVAGVFAYCLFLELGLRRSSALAGSLAFTLGGGYASLAVQVVNLNSAAWVPGIFWLGLRTAGARSLRPALGLGALLGLQILGGEPEISYLTLLTLSAYLFFRAGFGAPGSRLRATLGRLAPRLGLAFVIGLGLSSAQWLLSLEMTRLSNRAEGLSLDRASSYSFDPGDLSSILIPHYLLDSSSPLWAFGFWSGQFSYFASIYPGVIAVLLSLFAFRAERRREALFWAGVGMVSVVLALGPAGFLYSAAHRLLPGFNRFRFPERALLGFAFAMAWLAALGLEALPARVGRFENLPGRRTALTILAAAAAVLFAALLTPLRPTSNPTDYLFSRSALRSLLLAIAFLLVLLGLASSRRRQWLPAGVIVLLALDLFLAHRRLNPTTDRSLYTFTPAWVQELGSSSGAWPLRAAIVTPTKVEDRYVGSRKTPRDFYLAQRGWLQPFAALSFRIGDLNARSSLDLALEEELRNLMARANMDQFNRLLSICGVQNIAIPGPGVRPAPEPLPRAYLAFAERRAETHARALELLLNSGFDPRQEVLLEGETGSPRLDKTAPIQPVEVKRYSNEQVDLELAAERPAWLVLLDTFYPGWQARVDGRPAVIRQANGFFRAVPVPAGRHRVELVYRPTHWRLAGAVTLATVLLIGGLWVFSGRPARGESS